MKFLILFLIFLGSFMLFFFLLSAIGILWLPYKQIITDSGWFFWYAALFGWWIATLCSSEYFEKHIV